MKSFRNVNENDILKEWFNNKEENLFHYLTKEDKKHNIFIDEISKNILKNVPKQNEIYVNN